MRKPATKLPMVVALTLVGLVLAASGIGTSSPAAAFGGFEFGAAGFGRGGGFGGPARGRSPDHVRWCPAAAAAGSSAIRPAGTEEARELGVAAARNDSAARE